MEAGKTADKRTLQELVEQVDDHYSDIGSRMTGKPVLLQFVVLDDASLTGRHTFRLDCRPDLKWVHLSTWIPTFGLHPTLVLSVVNEANSGDARAAAWWSASEERAYVATNQLSKAISTRDDLMSVTLEMANVVNSLRQAFEQLRDTAPAHLLAPDVSD